MSYYQKQSVIPGIPVPDYKYDIMISTYRWLVRIMLISVILVGFVELIVNMMHNSTVIDTSKNTSDIMTLVQVIFGATIAISSLLVGIISIYYAKKYNIFAANNRDPSQFPLIGVATFSMYILLFIIFVAYGSAILGVALERSSCISNNLSCISTAPRRVAGPITLV